MEGWNPCFSRPFNDWKVGVVENFLVRLHGKRVCKDVENTVLWIEMKNDKVSLKSLYNTLEPGNFSSFPLRNIWNMRVQPKISFFAWEAMWVKALTLDLVQKRG